MSELADYKSAHAGAGWSAVGGQTINVYVSPQTHFSSKVTIDTDRMTHSAGRPRFTWNQLER